MATDSGNNTDPNEKFEQSKGPDHPSLSEDELFGNKLNPVRETADPFTGLRDGGSGSSSG